MNAPVLARCPKCGPTQELWPAHGALHEDVCGRCRGRFLQTAAVERVLVEEQGIARETLLELSSFFAGKRLACPGCGAQMAPVTIRGVPADLCPGCGGMWCDAGELARLSAGRHVEVAAPAERIVEAPPVPAPRERPSLLARAVAAAKEIAAPHVERGTVESTDVILAGHARPGARWCLVQQTVEPLDPERVRAAFQKTGLRTAAEAAQMVQSAFGIFADALNEEEAQALEQALRAEGLVVERVPAERIALPRARNVTRYELTEAALVVTDTVGAKQPLPWGDVAIAAVGLVIGQERVQRRVTLPDASAFTYGAMGEPIPIGREVDLETRLVDALLIDLTLARGQRLRLTAQATGMLEVAGVGRSNAFVEAGRAIARRSTGATLTSGAQAMREGKPPVKYRSLRVYEREQAWCWSRRS